MWNPFRKAIKSSSQPTVKVVEGYYGPNSVDEAIRQGVDIVIAGGEGLLPCNVYVRHAAVAEKIRKKTGWRVERDRSREPGLPYVACFGTLSNTKNVEGAIARALQ